MTLPMTAQLEAVLSPSVALWDVSRVLPRHAWRKYGKRAQETIERVYSHHSGADGRSGYQGALNSARYVVDQRNWAGGAYHFWLPDVPDVDPYGRSVVYRMHADTTVSWHTGGLNSAGVGVCWQGNLRDRVPSDEQYALADALYPWLQERYSLERPDGFSWHAEAARWGGRPKASCPGPAVTFYVQRFREMEFAA